jgi:hypothetical protein
MGNLFTPQRMDGESFKDYVYRRKLSQLTAKRMTTGMPLKILSQQSNHAPRVRKHPFNGIAKVMKSRKLPFDRESHPPTWPRGDDQRQQGRPVIVISPVRALNSKFFASNPPAKDGTRSLTKRQIIFIASCRNAPKYIIDGFAA